jgi:hypothetical protein
MADVVYRWLRNIIGQAIESSLNEIRKSKQRGVEISIILRPVEQASDKSSRRKSKHRRDLDRLKTIYVRHEQPMYWQAMHQASMGMYWVGDGWGSSCMHMFVDDARTHDRRI